MSVDIGQFVFVIPPIDKFYIFNTAIVGHYPAIQQGHIQAAEIFRAHDGDNIICYSICVEGAWKESGILQRIPHNRVFTNKDEAFRSMCDKITSYAHAIQVDLKRLIAKLEGA